MRNGKSLLFGMAIPQIFQNDSINIDYIAKGIINAEKLGYHSLWVQEQPIGNGNTLEPLTLLSFASGLTNKIKLGSSVILTPLRSPVSLAKTLATLDQLSRGRLIVGVGLGNANEDYAAFGISTDNRAMRFETGIDLMKKLWTDDSVDFDNEFWSMSKTSVTPKPKQVKYPPIWFGGHAIAAIRRSVRMGDGWMGAGSSTISDFTSHLKLVRKYMAEEGKTQDSFTVSKRVYIAVESTEQVALDKLEKWFNSYYGSASMAGKVSIFGTAEQCTEKLKEIKDADVDLILLNPLYDSLTQAKRLAEYVIPSL